MQTNNDTKEAIEWAEINWKNGQPFSSVFSDVYFSTDNGLAETEYVFIEGNALTTRWQTLQQQPQFTIVETGFGTGLNFLCAAKLWLKLAPTHAKLHFISVEKHPLTTEQLQQALQLWPQLNEFYEPLIAQYPTLTTLQPSIQLFNQQITLTLLIGDATEEISQIGQPVDAWFLDGFAPSQNPEMWQPKLFSQMARLSNAGTTFATFTSAGEVRRGLIAAGFKVFKRSGFGKKREMLQGIWPNMVDESSSHG